MRLLRQGKAFEAFDIELGQQGLIAAPGITQRVAQQGEDQGGLINLGLPQFKAGDQQRILQPLHQLRRKHRVA